jgi:flagellar motor switch protein FliN/FliY
MTAGNRFETEAGLAAIRRTEQQSALELPALNSDQTPAVPEEWGVRGHEAVMRIPVSVMFVLGSTKMTVAKLLGLKRGSIVPLDRKVGDPVDIVVNDRIVARGEVVVLDGDTPRFAVSIKEVVESRND